MGFSDDFKRAMKEAVYGEQADALKTETPIVEAPVESDTANFTKPIVKPLDEPILAEPKQTYSPQGIKKPTYKPPEFEAPTQEEVTPEYAYFEDVNTTIFSSGTVVHGTVESDGAVSMKGELIGDIRCKADLTVTGKIQGGVTAQKILLQDAVIQGNITCGTTINITTQTQIMGNLSTKEAIIDGRIMGNIEAEGAVIAGETAVIIGDVTAYTVQIRKGSYFEGRVIMTGAAGDKAKLFNKFKLTEAE